MKTTAFFLTLTTAAFAQGPLAPSGAPAPTMKSLDQIEARTAIPATTGVPGAGPHYSISLPGSYYLTGNVQVTSGAGIRIFTSNVTLDLNGFALISTAAANPSSGNAIDLVSNVRNIEIKNGRITGGTIRTQGTPDEWDASFAKAGWFRGIGDVNTNPAQGVLLSHLTVERCADFGIYLNGSSVLDQITAVGNGGSGIYVRESSISNVIASRNSGNGIEASECSISNANASRNGGNGIKNSEGSVTNANASRNGGNGLKDSDSVTNSTASFNGGNGIDESLSVTNATANYNRGTGITSYFGSVTNASVNSNALYGIYLRAGSISNATASYNGGIGIGVFSPGGGGGSVTNCRAWYNALSGIHVGTGVAAHCLASNNSTNPATVDLEIVVVSGGQRDACVPISE